MAIHVGFHNNNHLWFSNVRHNTHDRLSTGYGISQFYGGFHKWLWTQNPNFVKICIALTWELMIWVLYMQLQQSYHGTSNPFLWFGPIWSWLDKDFIYELFKHVYGGFRGSAVKATANKVVHIDVKTKPIYKEIIHILLRIIPSK